MCVLIQSTGTTKSFFTFKEIIRFHGIHLNAILFTPVRNIRTSLLRFPQNMQKLNSIVWRSLTPNFTQIRQKFDNYEHKLIQVLK